MKFAKPAFLLAPRRACSWSRRCSIVGLAGRAMAQLRVDITQGTIQPMPIAIPPFVGAAGSVDELSQNVAQVVTADLKRSGLFAPVDPSAFIEPVVPPSVTPNFANWRPLNAQALVSGSVTHDRRRPHHGRVPAVGRVLRPVPRRKAVLRLARQLAAARPHHRRFRSTSG